jgi:hypothetical protein
MFLIHAVRNCRERSVTYVHAAIMSVCSSGPLADITQGVLDSSQVQYNYKVVKIIKIKI